jgi:hypothetical protein
VGIIVRKIVFITFLAIEHTLVVREIAVADEIVLLGKVYVLPEGINKILRKVTSASR